MFYKPHTLNGPGPDNIACTSQTGPTTPGISANTVTIVRRKETLEQTNKHKFYFIKYSETQCTVNLKHKNSCSRRVYKTKYLNYQGQYILNMYQVANMWVTIYKSPKIEDKREFMDPLDKYKRVQKILEYHFYQATHAFFEERIQKISSNQFVLMKIIFRENMW